MSQARVYTSVFAARKGATLACEVDRAPILKGERYRWFKVGFRSRYKHVRCMRAEHSPRASDLESSMLSGAYAAIESAEDTLVGLAAGDPEDNNDSIKEAVQGAAEGVREVADQYSEAADAMGEAGADMQERADNLESAADDLESFDGETDEPDFDGCENDQHDLESENVERIDRGDTEACDECRDIKADWWSSEIDAGNEALASVDFG